MAAMIGAFGFAPTSARDRFGHLAAAFVVECRPGSRSTRCSGRGGRSGRPWIGGRRAGIV